MNLSRSLVRKISDQVERIRAGETRAVARALTQVENGCWEEETQELLKQLFPFTGQAFIVGVTGSPGAGKSTLVDQLARGYRSLNKRVGVIAVDPTSPFSGGAVLGDRIRMQELASDKGVFIRSMATRGQMGGLSPSIFEALVVLDSAGYEVVIVETVGVGQDEVDIVKTADVSLVVLVPGMGDDIQTIKAGIMEIGDILVVNKADREGVLRAEQELQALLALGTRPDGWEPPVIRTVATHGTGITELLAAVEEYHGFLGTTDHHGGRRLRLYQNRLLKMLRDRLTQDILEKVPESELRSLAEQMMNRQKDPYTIVKRLLSEVCSGEEGHD